MRLVVIGTGYVGLVTGVCLSEIGHDVICVDKDLEKVRKLNERQVPIYEPGLQSIMIKNMDAKRLSFTQDLPEAVSTAEAVFIAVGTPTRSDGNANLTSIFNVTGKVARAAQKNIIVVIKSTVPVGTNRKVFKSMCMTNPNVKFDIASNPEFLREGAAIDDFMTPDRIVVGSRTKNAAKVMRSIYRPLRLTHSNFVDTDPESAEMIKYASNAMLAAKVSFINEIAALCEKTGADVCEVSKGVGLDKRIGERFLDAGPGYGGSCFPKDTSALACLGRENSSPMTIVEAVISANQVTKNRMIKKLRDLMDGSFDGQRIAIFGVTFKPDTDDMRGAPSLDIVDSLIGDGAEVAIVDPMAHREGESLFRGVEWMSDPYEAAKDADLVVIITEWKEFRALDLARIAGAMRVPRMADLRNIYNSEIADQAGFHSYQSVGRASFEKHRSIGRPPSLNQRFEGFSGFVREENATRCLNTNMQSP